MMKKLLPILFFFSLGLSLSAQQLPLFTQYGEYRSLLNPSSVTNDYFLHDFNVSVGVSSRFQWVGVPGTPKTNAAHADFLIDRNNTFSLVTGAYILNHSVGPISTTGIYGRLASIMSDYDPLYGGISLGLTTGMIQYRVDVSQLRQLYPNDILTLNNQNRLSPDLGVGFTYYKNFNRGRLKDDIFYFGLSVPQILGLQYSFNDDFGNFSYEQVRHYYGFLSYFKSLRESSFLEFSTWIKYADNAPYNVDFNVRYQMSSVVWIGGGLSSAGIGHAEIGLYLENGAYSNSGNYNRLKISFSYDPPFTSYGARFGGSYEVSVGYALDNRGL